MNLHFAKTNLPPSRAQKAACGPAPGENPIRYRHGRPSLAVLAALVGFVCSGFGAPRANPPDVLFIISEDLATCLGSYGIIRAPGVTPVGSSCKRPVSQIDLFPTLTDLCGLGAPSGLEGISMAPLLRDPSRPWKKGAFTSMGNGTSVRTERYRYNEWGGPEQAELYDHETDPRELRNLAKDPKYRDLVAGLSALIKGGWKATLPGP